MVSYPLFAYLLVFSIIAMALVFFPVRKGVNKIFLIVTPIILLALIFTGYHYWGAGTEWQDYQQQLIKQEQIKALVKSVKGKPQLLIEKLKARLAKEPESARGWYLLGRLYASQNEWQQAFQAYEKAHQLAPDNEEATINYVQSLWHLNHRQFNKEIRELFQLVLQKNPKQPDALAMLAMDAFIRHAYQQAINYWQELLDIVPPQSADAQAIRKAIAKAVQNMS